MKLRTGLAALLVTPMLFAGSSYATTSTQAGDASAAERASSVVVTLKTSNATPTVGDRIKLVGRVSPGRAAGVALHLQVLYDNRKAWKTVDTGKVTTNGRFRFVEKIQTARTRKYRVVTTPDARHARSVSNKVKVVAYDWVSLLRLPAANNTGWRLGGSTTVNGIAYPDSVSSVAPAGALDVNLARACTSLDAGYGLDDSSPSAGSATIGVATDGSAKYAQSFGLSQSQHIVLDVSGAFRVTFSYATTSGGEAVVGSPKALCHG